MTDSLKEKIQKAEQVLKLASEMSLTYYGKPLILCYSGGKDSDVMLDIAKRCLEPDKFEVLNSHTTVDAPETVYYIREVFKRCEAEGIHTEIHLPTFRGKPTSMWKLIELMGMPPTRIQRYCCKVLKETSVPNRMIAVGVREDESNARKGRDVFSTRAKRKDDAEHRSLQHTYAMFKLDQSGNPNAYECVFIQNCKAKKDSICNPIYFFTKKDIWDYIDSFGLKINPLYSMGFHRVGCIGCPLGGGRGQQRDFAVYPKYRENYKKAFERMNKRNIEKKKINGKPIKEFDLWSGEDWIRWWVGENPKQIRFEDLINDERTENNG